MTTDESILATLRIVRQAQESIEMVMEILRIQGETIAALIQRIQALESEGESWKGE